MPRTKRKRGLHIIFLVELIIISVTKLTATKNRAFFKSSPPFSLFFESLYPRYAAAQRTAIPIEVLTYFANQSDSETKIYLKATTTIHNGSSNSSYSGSDDLTLKKLGLLRLE